MTDPARDLDQLLRTLQPEQQDGVYVFASVPAGTDIRHIATLATFREREGVTIIAEEREAERAGLVPLFRAAWITLTVHSDLHAVGLTAAVASALSAAGISCNIVAAAHHDHVFVPVESGPAALAQLAALQARARQRRSGDP